jgi:hypothetical protein
MADAEPVPRLVEIHDDVDVTGEIMTAPTDQQLIDFVIRETRLIDQHRFEEWLDLFAEDGFYWMPLEWGQTDPRLTTSLMYEDKLLLKIRVERLKGGQRIRHVDADALCRDAARPAGPLCRLGDAHAGYGRRCAQDQAEAGRHRQLRCRLRQYPAVHVRP